MIYTKELGPKISRLWTTSRYPASRGWSNSNPQSFHLNPACTGRHWNIPGKTKVRFKSLQTSQSLKFTSSQDPKRWSLESLDTALALAWWAYETAGLILHVNEQKFFLLHSEWHVSYNGTCSNTGKGILPPNVSQEKTCRVLWNLCVVNAGSWPVHLNEFRFRTVTCYSSTNQRQEKCGSIFQGKRHDLQCTRRPPIANGNFRILKWRLEVLYHIRPYFVGIFPYI